MEDAEQMAAAPVHDIATDRATGDATTYDLSGRRVSTGARGIVIRNGRKMVK